MVKRTSACIVKTLCLTVLLLGFVGSAASVMAADSALRLRLGVASEEGGPRAQLAEALIDAVSRELGGSVELELVVDSGGQGPEEVIRQVANGTLDMALVESWAFGERYKNLQLINQPLVFPNRQRAFSFYYGSGGEKIGEALSVSGIRVLTWIPCLPWYILAEKPMAESADYKGMRLASRVNPVWRTAMEELGGEYVPLQPADLSDVLGSGLADAFAADLTELAAGTIPPEANQLTESGMFFPYLAVCGAEAAMARIQGEQKERFSLAMSGAIVEITQKMYAENEATKARLSADGFVFGTDNYGELLLMLTPSAERAASLSDPSLIEDIEKNNAPQEEF